MFFSRSDAGKRLAKELQRKVVVADFVVGIARGGVVVAKEIAAAFNLPLRVLVVKKIGAPGNPELALGALTRDIVYLDKELINIFKIKSVLLDSEVESIRKQLRAREKLYLAGNNSFSYSGTEVIIADDGIATGATVIAAVKQLKIQGVVKITLAVPVATKETLVNIKSYVDTCVILEEPETFRAVGEFYKDFPQITDEEVIKLLGVRH